MSAAQSVRSHKSQFSQASRQQSVVYSQTSNKMTAYHVDRAATLIPDDDQWNKIVQKTLEDGDLADALKKANRAEKLKAIQAE